MSESVYRGIRQVSKVKGKYIYILKRIGPKTEPWGTP